MMYAPNPGEYVSIAANQRVKREDKAAHDSLITELAAILGPGKPPSGVGREEYWIGRVGMALAAVEAERDALRAQLADLVCETSGGLCSPLCCNRPARVHSRLTCPTCKGSGVDRLIPESEIRAWVLAYREHPPVDTGHSKQAGWALDDFSAWLDGRANG